MQRAGLLRRGRLALLLVAVAVPPAALADEDEGAWRPVRVASGPCAALLDCRSLTVEHERRVALGSTWSLGDHGVRFERTEDRLQVVLTAPGADKPSVRALKPPPVLVPLKAFDARYALTVRLARGGDAVWMASAYGAELRMGSERAYLVDSDLDGRLGTPGDGYVAPGTRTVAPWSSQVWTRRAAYAYRVGTGRDWERAVLPMPYADDEDHAEAWRLLQWRRQQCGLLPVEYKPELERGIRLHADYCVENGYRGHDQVRSGKAFSAEGARAGRESVLGYGVGSLVEGMEQQLATLYHRNGLLQPALTHTAMALHRGVFGANVRDSSGGPLADRLIVVPPHGMRDVPRRFNPGGETPMPVAGRQVGLAELGTSVGAFAASFEQARTLAEKPSLSVTRLIGARRKRGPSFRLDLYYPGRVPHDRVPASNYGNVALTPPRPLEARTTYLCALRVFLPRRTHTSLPPSDPFEYEWEFTTGK